MVPEAKDVIFDEPVMLSDIIDDKKNAMPDKIKKVNIAHKSVIYEG